MRPKAVIVDLDGTLCNADHRLHHIQKTPKDWDTFFSLVHLDSPNEWCSDLVKAFYKSNEYEVIFLTGRNIDSHEETLNWLCEHMSFMRFEHIRDNLYMRGRDDRRPDTEVKTDIFENQLKPKYRVMFAVDDRARVIEMWRGLGIPALQCADWEDKDPAVAKEIHNHFLGKMDAAEKAKEAQ